MKWDCVVNAAPQLLAACGSDTLADNPNPGNPAAAKQACSCGGGSLTVQCHEVPSKRSSSCNTKSWACPTVPPNVSTDSLLAPSPRNLQSSRMRQGNLSLEYPSRQQLRWDVRLRPVDGNREDVFYVVSN